ncbi:hypothetical protein HELRODRAFT_158808 [Helobdella robusta]|uniref:Uncharacterized protein n=1 Tax=Helobdella robusta TaxID=6412 RepID=T1ENA4_HELRO|nr:hypothetical protein HELRODRAFT_158808 [Helobdella robusta]ESO12315.1 hypothetical protein HELRODRAFT_158808 [Helobdella robusta]
MQLEPNLHLLHLSQQQPDQTTEHNVQPPASNLRGDYYYYYKPYMSIHNPSLRSIGEHPYQQDQAHSIHHAHHGVQQMFSNADLECLSDRHWYAFLCSSFITFFGGLFLVLSWRILSWMCCQRKAVVTLTGKSGYRKGEAVNSEVGWVTEAKDWAGELISGQTTTGRILVSGHFKFDILIF